MNVSVLEPVSLALERTGNVLFRRFDLAKWITLGFCAWLAHLGQESMSFRVRMPLGGGPVQFGPAPPAPPGRPRGKPPANPEAEFRQAMQNVGQWLGDNAALAATVAVIGIAVALAVWLLVLWLKARGTFMFLDGVVRNRGEVARPWGEYAREANSLFRFQIVFSVATSLLGLCVVAASAAVAWPDIRKVHLGEYAVGGLVVLGSLGSLLAVAGVVLQTLLVDFAVPIMYLRRQGTVPAWREFGRSILPGHAGTMVLYLLLRFVVDVVGYLVAIVITCATCCIAALPYVGTVVLLPLFVFDRAFPLYVLEQFGPDWRIFPSAEKPPLLILDDLPPHAE